MHSTVAQEEHQLEVMRIFDNNRLMVRIRSEINPCAGFFAILCHLMADDLHRRSALGKLDYNCAYNFLTAWIGSTSVSTRVLVWAKVSCSITTFPEILIQDVHEDEIEFFVHLLDCKLDVQEAWDFSHQFADVSWIFRAKSRLALPIRVVCRLCVVVVSETAILGEQISDIFQLFQVFVSSFDMIADGMCVESEGWP